MERLKQKVASSRVFASLQQVASTTTGASQQQQQQQQQHQAGPSAATTTTVAPVGQPGAQVSPPDGHLQQVAAAGGQAPVATRPIVPEAAMSTAWLMAADATAHLTDEEKGILLQVFKKEEQFQRDTIKQLTASRAQQQRLQAPPAGRPANTNKENHHHHQQHQQRLFTATTPALSSAAARRQYNKNNQSSASMCSSSGTAMNSVSSATPTSSNQSSRPCSCNTGTCGHATPITLTNTSTASDSQTPQQQMMAMMGMGMGTATGTGMAAARTQSRNSATPSTSSLGHQIDNKSATSNDRSAAAATPNIGQCRICRKTIEPSEPCHLCSNCNQFICDDCASYSATDQFWMCSSCRRRAMNPAIPAEALKELGLNQNSSAVRRMTLRLNQNELKMAANKCLGEPVSSQTPTSSVQPASDRLGQRGQSASTVQQQQQQLLRRQSSARRTTSDGDSSESAAGDVRRAPPALSRQNSLQQQQQQLQSPTSRRTLNQSSSQAQLMGQRQSKAHKSAGEPARQGQQLQRETSGQSGGQLVRPSSRQRPKSGMEPLKRVDSSHQQHRLGAQKTLSQPTAASAQQQQQQQQQPPRETRAGQPKWAEPEAKRAPSTGHPSQRRDSLNLQLDQRIEQSISSMVAGPEVVAPSQLWPAQRQTPTSAGAYLGSSQAVGGEPQPFEHGMAAHPPPPSQAARAGQDSQQFVRGMLANHRNSLAFSQFQPALAQQVMGGALGSAHQLPSSIGSSRRGSCSQQPAGAYMSQLIPVPPEQMHLRRLSDQSNLVRRSSIIASNLFDGTTIARNRSHSNIDSVHHLHQQQALMGSRQQVDDGFGYAFWQPPVGELRPGREAGKQLEVGGRELNSSSASNLHFLQPSQQQQQQEQLQQRRLSDGCQYFGADQQPIAAIVTSYAQKQQSRRRQRQSSEEVHSDSSSDLDQAAGGALQSGVDSYEDSYPFQQPINIPSVSVSEFAAAAARRRSSIHLQQQQQQQQQRQQQQQQQQCDDQLMANFQQDNQITPMQINVAIEQVIQQQEQLMPACNEQDAQFLYIMRRGSGGGRLLPSIPGCQSRSLLELPLNGGAASQTGGLGQLEAAGNTGAGSGKLSNGHSRHGSTAGQATLGLPCLSPTIRRASAPEGQIIKIVVDDIDSSLPFGVARNHHQNGMKYHQFDQQIQAGYFYERHILYRDDSLDPNGNHVGRGFGLQVMGGKLNQEGRLQACVKWVLQGGPADKVGIKPGDKLIEWDGKCLVDMSYEQVAEVIESSANIAEVLVKPKPQRLYDPNQPPANYVRSQRRLSHQTERDLRRYNQTPVASGAHSGQSAGQRRLSCAVQAANAAGGEIGGRMGTGRRLPQIPPANSQHQTGGPDFGQLGVIPQPIRHASTGQLDQAMVGPLLNNLAGSQMGGPGMNQSGYHLGTYHLEQQQQSRSAGELHRGGVAGLSHQQAQANHMGNPGDGPGLSVGGWMQPQQYGGSQQMTTAAFGVPSKGNNTGHMTQHGSDEFGGLIGLQVNVDERLATLEISVLSAHNIDRDPTLDYVVKVRILPENNRFKVCTTQPSSDMNWKETFLFQNFPIHQVQRMALEIGIWVYDEAPMLSAQISQPICEALIPIQSARERNIDFWPLRPPPTSPQTRRKSLNDLMGNHYGQKASDQSARAVAGYKAWPINKPGQEMAHNTSVNDNKVGLFGSPVRVPSVSSNDSPSVIQQRERSSSIRNLPDTSKTTLQPRRASDEVATSSSHRLLARLSPAVSRRSISVMNVGDGYAGGRASKSPVSRLGSQANILKVMQMRRDSTQIKQQRDQCGNDSPIKYVSGGG